MKPSAGKNISKATAHKMFQPGFKLAFETKPRKKMWDDLFPLWYAAAMSGHVRAQFPDT